MYANLCKQVISWYEVELRLLSQVEHQFNYIFINIGIKYRKPKTVDVIVKIFNTKELIVM